jgi:superfamily I DNA and/or RNA helicase
VPAAYAEGTSTRLRNPLEATAIAEAIVARLSDSTYDDRTFGVVVLQGTGQVALIQDLLHERVPAAVWEQRKLRVGTPPDFQGDGRHVMFASMVVAATPRAVTAMEWQRRFNVAASRAQDQMWLFHSVTLDALSTSDLRYSHSHTCCTRRRLTRRHDLKTSPTTPHTRRSTRSSNNAPSTGSVLAATM